MIEAADNNSVPLDTDYIRKRRLYLKLTQAAAANQAKFPNAQKWSQYENGRIRDPQLSTIETMARVLRCKTARLIRSR